MTPYTWTSEPPTVPGWYWWREESIDDTIVEIYECAGCLTVDGQAMEGIPLKGLTGEWAGPLELPGEKEG